MKFCHPKEPSRGEVVSQLDVGIAQFRRLMFLTWCINISILGVVARRKRELILTIFIFQLPSEDA